MKRSEINQIIQDAKDLCEKYHFKLPPFAFWTPRQWKHKGKEVDEIRRNQLGWDITDFGSGHFDRVGLVLFTIRNGNYADVKKKTYTALKDKCYAEKLLIVQEMQVTPIHFHWKKMEDIIVREGGNLVVQVWNSTASGQLNGSLVTVTCDGEKRTVPAGARIVLTPGESITLPPGQYHQFWGQKGKGTILVGEVSKVNDDRIDNRFYEKVGRFPRIEEDVPPLHLLYTEYPPT